MSIISFSRVRSRLAGLEAHVVSSRIEVAIIAAIHLAALALLYHTEWGPVHGALALLAWGFLNFLWLVILRRPMLSAALSLVIIVALIVLSQFNSTFFGRV